MKKIAALVLLVISLFGVSISAHAEGLSEDIKEAIRNGESTKEACLMAEIENDQIQNYIRGEKN